MNLQHLPEGIWSEEAQAAFTDMEDGLAVTIISAICYSSVIPLPLPPVVYGDRDDPNRHILISGIDGNPYFGIHLEADPEILDPWVRERMGAAGYEIFWSPEVYTQGPTGKHIMEQLIDRLISEVGPPPPEVEAQIEQLRQKARAAQEVRLSDNTKTQLPSWLDDLDKSSDLFE